MFDIGWSEIAVIAVIALIAIGPKELPGVLRMVGQWMGKARRMASEFQGQFNEAMREAEMADLKKSFDEVKEAASGFTGGSLMDVAAKGCHSRAADRRSWKSRWTRNPRKTLPAASSETVASSDAVATSSDALPPVTPTTPEAPTSETFIEATTHAAVTEPLVITPQALPEPVAPATAEIPRDAKAS